MTAIVTAQEISRGWGIDARRPVELAGVDGQRAALTLRGRWTPSPETQDGIAVVRHAGCFWSSRF